MADSGVGAMLGAIVGDIVGSPFEFTGHKSKSFDLFSPASSFTDDTVCLIGVADALLRDVPIAACLRGWCRQYPHPVGGYGARFREWVFSDTMGAYNSKGNGAAMRVAPVAHLAKDASQAVSLAWHVTAITHDHPDAMNGAAATAFAIWMARSGANPHEIRGKIESEYGFDLSRSVDQIRATYQYSELCLETVPEALVCALTATDFEDALRNAVSLAETRTRSRPSPVGSRSRSSESRRAFRKKRYLVSTVTSWRSFAVLTRQSPPSKPTPPTVFSYATVRLYRSSASPIAASMKAAIGHRFGQTS